MKYRVVKRQVEGKDRFYIERRVLLVWQPASFIGHDNVDDAIGRAVIMANKPKDEVIWEGK